MAKMKFDFKQVMLAHGERIGLGVAGFLAVLLLATSLFWPGHGLFSGSSSEKAKILDETTSWIDARLRDPNNLPGDADKPPKDAKKQLIPYESTKVNPVDYTMANLDPGDTGGSLGRRMPTIYTIAEGAAEAKLMNIARYVFPKGDPPRLVALKSDGGSGTSPSAVRGAYGSGGGRGGSPGMMPPGGMGGRGGAGGQAGSYGRGLGRPGLGAADEDKKDKQTVLIKLDELDKHPDLVLAEQNAPAFMAVIAASFPYKKQLEEFRAKLGLRSIEDVINETSSEKKDANAPPSFRFLGVNLERRELDGNGKPITPFTAVNLNEDYLPFVFYSGKRFEPEDPAMEAIAFDNLVMPKLKQFDMLGKKGAEGASRGGKGPMMSPSPLGPGGRGGPAPATPEGEDMYPKVEKKLTLLNETLEKLKAQGPNVVPTPPKQFQTKDFNVFNSKRIDNDVPDNGPGIGAFPGRKGGPGDNTTPKTEIPDYCLVRLVDVSVQPGKTYEYRIQVRMANPNYHRHDLASPSYGDKPELVSEWSKLEKPITVNSEPDLYYYAIDQKELHNLDSEEKLKGRYKGPYIEYNKDRAVLLQAHRWLNTTPIQGGGDDLIIGDWAVADRFAVERGEYVGRTHRVEVPYWRYPREAFVIATDPSTKKSRPGIEVLFGYQAPNSVQPEAILVDFENGPRRYDRVVSRKEDTVETRAVNDGSAAEVLLLNPDGKLFLLEGALDAVDKGRKTRREAVHKRLEHVRTGGKSDEKDPKNPFGK